MNVKKEIVESEPAAGVGGSQSLDSGVGAPSPVTRKEKRNKKRIAPEATEEWEDVDDDVQRLGFSKAAASKGKTKVKKLEKAMQKGNSTAKKAPDERPKPDYHRLALRSQPSLVCLGDERKFMWIWDDLKRENELKFTIKSINESLE